MRLKSSPKAVYWAANMAVDVTVYDAKWTSYTAFEVLRWGVYRIVKDAVGRAVEQFVFRDARDHLSYSNLAQFLTEVRRARGDAA